MITYKEYKNKCLEDSYPPKFSPPPIYGILEKRQRNTGARFVTRAPVLRIFINLLLLF